eukprot:11288326-Prorocentrum_lima.AAC.1
MLILPLLHRSRSGLRGSPPFVRQSLIMSRVSSHQSVCNMPRSSRSRIAFSRYNECGSAGLLTSFAAKAENNPLLSVATCKG